MSAIRLLVGDCRELLPTLQESSVDATVCDPPYGLGFMGQGWDRGVPGVEFWRAVHRVQRAGMYLLAFGGTRTYHRIACAIEDAGFELHDCLAWLYGSGFPKHRSKLKPAWEPIILARKPAAKATPLHIDDCRIPVADAAYAANCSGDRGHGGTRDKGERGVTDLRSGGGSASDLGRWPANVVLDEEAAALLDAQTGTLVSGANPTRRGSDRFRTTYGDFVGQRECEPARGADSGGTSRFYYCAKASREERDLGCEALPYRPLNWSSGEQSPGTFQSEGTRKSARNFHPTVKPIALMRWLVRLVTPPGGTVLDPFAGSGTTGCAAALEGRAFIGCEADTAFAEIARARLGYWSGAELAP